MHRRVGLRLDDWIVKLNSLIITCMIELNMCHLNIKSQAKIPNKPSTSKVVLSFFWSIKVLFWPVCTELYYSHMFCNVRSPSNIPINSLNKGFSFTKILNNYYFDRFTFTVKYDSSTGFKYRYYHINTKQFTLYLIELYRLMKKIFRS